MVEKARFFFTALAAFAMGWYGHSLYQPPINADNTRSPSTASTQPHTISGQPANQPANRPAHTNNNVTAADSSRPIVYEIVVQSLTPETILDENEALALFAQLLDNYKFDAAINLYFEQELDQQSAEWQRWRGALLTFLSQKLNTGEITIFNELAQAWLQTHYNDVDVLLLQSRYYSAKGYYGEALQTYMQANTYANVHEQKIKVFKELQSFVFKRDLEWSELNNWYELLNFYTQLYQIGITNKAQDFRYAELLLMHNEEKLADDILKELAKSYGWKTRVAQLQKAYQRDGEYHAGNASAPGFQSAINLKPAGSHHIINVRINNIPADTALLLDTGASITTLSLESFSGLVDAEGWQDLGWRTFNTANGPTRGRLMQVQQLQLGEFTLQNIAIAVLDTKIGEKIHGLLGMNVLSQFHFQIDQDHHKLLLTPRE